jgi:hypothetical protein
MINEMDIVLSFGKMFSNDVGLMMIHRFVYEYLAEHLESHDVLRPYSNSAIAQSGIAFYVAMQEHAKTLDDGGRQLPIFGVRKIPFNAEANDWVPFRNPFCLLFSDDRDETSSPLSIVNFNDYRRTLTELAIKQIPVTDEVVKDLIYSLTRFWRFDRNFQLLRKSYMPQAGAGSQDDNTRLYRNLNAVVMNELFQRATHDDEEDWS